jgi:transposase
MSKPAENLSDDPAVLKAMIAALQAENAKISATLRVHDQLVQALRLRIAKLQKLAFSKSSKRSSASSNSWNWRLKTCWLRWPKTMMLPSMKGRMSRHQRPPMRPLCVAGHVSRMQSRASVMNWTPVPAAPTAAAICVWWVRMSANCWT